MAVVQMTQEQLQQLIESVRTAALTASGEAGTTNAKSKGSFSSCPARFGGQRDHEAVEEFITAVETYKEIEHITDKDALRGLSLLFYSLASTWWQGVKREAKTWTDAIEMIRSHFSPTKPAYQIYMEIFQTKQEERTAIDTFVCQKRALLAQLPEGRHTEETEIDLIYGLLHINYRKHIPRHDVKSFRDLLEKGRIIEHNNTEAYESSAGGSRDAAGKAGKRCTYCSYRGHTAENCRKKKTTDEE